MYEGTAVLRGEPSATFDEYGNEKLTYSETVVYVKPRSVYASEFYSAAQIGLHPTIVLELGNRADYNGEKQVIYEGDLYEVIRADWKNGREGIALTLGERVANNGY